MKNLVSNLDSNIENGNQRKSGLSLALDQKDVVVRLSKNIRGKFLDKKAVRNKTRFSEEVFISPEKYLKHEKLF